MLSKCMNPHCSATFRYLWEGRLFRVDFSEERRRKNAFASAAPEAGVKGPQRPIEHFWLCAGCAAAMTIAVSEDGEVRVVSHDSFAASIPSAEISVAQPENSGAKRASARTEAAISLMTAQAS